MLRILLETRLFDHTYETFSSTLQAFHQC